MIKDIPPLRHPARYGSVCRVNGPRFQLRRFPYRLRGRSGQAMLEYLICVAALVGVMALMALLLVTVRETSGRVLDLVASEYP